MSSVLRGVATVTVSGVVGPLSTVINIPSAAPTKAAEQSILSPPHSSPTIWNSADPIVLWIIQATIIIIMSRILSYFLGKIRQPRVIGDIITGLLLGPSVMGRIPNFTANIFPASSIPSLNLTANIGLVFFLFLVGVETDISVFRDNYKVASAVSLVGMILPFGAGAGIAVGIFHTFVDDNVVNFGHFILFIGTAMAITAFPVLARILTELRLLSDDVGVAALSAGVGNDVVGWILLALAVALTNASTGAVAVYILLCGVGLALILFLVVKPLLMRFIRRTDGFQKGPSQSTLIVIIVLILAAAFVTDIIGIHPIFGAFLVGLIMPHEARFASGLVEKIEDLITVLFLPLYFALSGLKTDLGLLNDGSIWGYTIGVILIAFVSKFTGCFAAAKLCGFRWRESLAVGSLMSCKGLVELIVLNVGLSAGILNNQVFAMFVVMALVTTFATTPLVMWFYPKSYRQQRALEKAEAALQGRRLGKGDAHDEGRIRSRFAVVLDRLDHLPSTMAFIKLLQPLPSWAILPSASSSEADLHDEKQVAETSVMGKEASEPVAVDALRLVELTERFTSVMRASETAIEARHDPLTNILRTFAGLNSIQLDTHLAVVDHAQFADAVVEHAAARSADMVMVPWAGATAGHGKALTAPNSPTSVSSPLDNLFGRSAPALESSPQYAAFVRRVFVDAPCDVGLFLDRSAEAGSAAMAAGKQSVFMAFHGGPDDRAALHFVVQLCRHPGITAHIVRIIRDDSVDEPDHNSLSKETTGATEEVTSPTHFTISGVGVSSPGADTIYGHHSTQTQLQSETTDNVAISTYFPSAGETETVLPEATRKALSRVRYSTLRTAKPLAATLGQAQAAAVAAAPAPLLVVAGRGRRAAASHATELSRVLQDIATSGDGQHALGLAASTEVRKTLGDVGSAFVARGGDVAGSLFVIQAGLPGAGAAGKKDA